MKQQRNESQTPPEPGANYGEMAIAFIALVPELLLHDPRTFGIRSVAARGGGAVLAMYIFALFYDHDNTRPLLILTLVIAVLAITAYLSAAINERRGHFRHTFYNGLPWLVKLLPVSEDWTKRTEPLLIVVTGWVLHHWNCPLGSFVITSGACHGFRVILDYLANRTRVLDFNDAFAEQSIAMQAMKRMRRR